MVTEKFKKIHTQAKWVLLLLRTDYTCNCVCNCVYMYVSFSHIYYRKAYMYFSFSEKNNIGPIIKFFNFGYMIVLIRLSKDNSIIFPKKEDNSIMIWAIPSKYKCILFNDWYIISYDQIQVICSLITSVFRNNPKFRSN